ncbi:MAG: hypothetical protein A3C93_02025 [Candidatus Lloydbacteria bacterium RIFCSPHIGHO2_02_FULL_54_17]|uniref:Uncharacterized protein n=1 Tax=Candidatus Lloydbacteria bacterium RIFCSPHIGHO2_02_FULL_54_17 TaxID=1798664 RepID=A0A1G2DI07_9BACT|nr:MAG: hypothetical protein A2762_05575 [Candidatus Lloydbacteria bacterium RIFCSPHIGHO2_01_FULL_54_11]OGZ13229.1 MAG: hypothetical protein A3C93_02025 [Candidatus Lloydbacteria bacterium RIFCSPHIGHO2_02_FULL_54_17]OGZ14888.1 MAG: hypothetical protein A3H76_02630 [Candidatus Lloydbacteria bacterium RIFCSPLOWO2_02_FULL_54_12]OGZ15359.1 MAG: hypothetical protein A2948_00040 [Candidatus Lloydbacteria bacterium RIFCSPLOWO2_01_FULL_54_18]
MSSGGSVMMKVYYNAIMRNFLLPAYLAERFPLGQFVPLSLAVVGSAAFVGALSLAVSPRPYMLFPAGLAFLLFLFRLRLLDEVKDAAHDKVHYPHRPLARGVVSESWVKRMVVTTLFGELVIALSFDAFVFALFLFALLYSFVMYKEFFVPEVLRRRFVAYVILHEVLSLPLFLYIYALLGIFVGRFTPPILLLLGMQAGGLFALEIARKLRRTEGKNNAGDTYPEHLGVFGATVSCGALFALSGICVLAVAHSARDVFPAFAVMTALLAAVLAWALGTFARAKDVASAKKVFLSGAIFVLLPQIVLATLYLNRAL